MKTTKVNCWKKVKDREFGNNKSIIYKNGNETLELFKDSMWGKHSKNMNVIVRDSSEKSRESSLGRTKLVEYADTEEQAKYFAKEYMELNNKCKRRK